MPMFSPLQAFGQPSAMDRYGVKRLTSYGGYPVIPASKIDSKYKVPEWFANEGKGVAGMAWGGQKNIPDQGKGEAPSVVVNPSYFKNNTNAYNGLVMLEGSRLWMNENSYSPKFKITPEMKAWREQFNPKKMGESGRAYYTDDNAFKQTIISRAIVGDGNLPPLTPEAEKEVMTVANKLADQDKKAKPSTSEMIMKAVKLIPSLRK
jgi:hypothetical protein